MNRFLRILLILAAWAAVTWIFREKLLPLPKPDPSPPPHFRHEDGSTSSVPASIEQRQSPAATAPPLSSAATVFTEPTATTSDQGMDDLTQVRGIGPVYRHRLAEIGIASFDDLLDGDAAEIAAAIDVNESQVREWIDQARHLTS